MARYLGPRCRLCRAQRQKLMLKGERCLSNKCPIDKKISFLRKGLPGKPLNVRLKKLSGYALQLKEKQKLKEMYGLMEKQFKRFFYMAQRMKGKTGDNLLILLERRLDNVIYRLHLASSRAQARQIVLHRHVLVNDKIVNIPSYLIKQGDVIKIREKSKNLSPIVESVKRAPMEGIPSWLEFNLDELKAVVKELPSRKEITYPCPVNEQLVVELYSK